jgi:hypothetical protein
MPKKSHPVAKQFFDEDMEQIKRYGQALSGSTTCFDEEVETYLRRIEANKKKAHRAKPAGSSLRNCHLASRSACPSGSSHFRVVGIPRNIKACLGDCGVPGHTQQLAVE